MEAITIMFTWSTVRPSTRPIIHQHSWRPSCAASKPQIEYDKMVSGMGISVGSLDVGYNVDTETREMLHLPEYESIFDDVTGVQLPPEKVDLARRKEIEFLFGFPVYKYVDDAEADGHEIVDTRWVDVNKGDRENMNR